MRTDFLKFFAPSLYYRAPRAVLLSALFALLIGCVIEGFAVVGSGNVFTNQNAITRFKKTPGRQARSDGARQVGRSKRKARTLRVAQIKRRAHHKTQIDQNPPNSKRPQNAGMTIKVLDRKGAPVSGITLAAVIHNNKDQDIPVKKVTNSNGNITLEKVGPLPASVDVDVDSPRWKLADVDSSSFYISETGGSARAGKVFVRPAVLTLNVKGAAGAVLSSPALLDLPDDAPAPPPGSEDKSVSVPESGNAQVEIKEANLEDGPVPLVLSKDVPGGKTEAIVTSYDENADSDEVQAPPLQLVSVAKINIASGLGVLSTDEEVERALGKMPKDKHKIFDAEDGLNDGSAWWWYQDKGVAVKMRPTNFKNQNIVERLRLLSPGAGNISGIGVGKKVDELYAALGEPQIKNDPQRFASDKFAPAQQIDTYLDGGLRFASNDGIITWIDIARPTSLLENGASSFAHHDRARVFVADFQGNPRLNLKSLEAFKNYLQQLPSVELVDSQDAADLVLSARVVSFTEDKDQLFGSTIPYDYKCNTTIEYDLRDVATGKYIAQNKRLEGEGHASFRSEIYKAIAAAVGIKVIIGGGISKYGPWVVGGALLYDLKRKMKNAANRCPGISERAVFSSMAQEISDAIDFNASITKIDYTSGLITLGIGSEDGVRASTPAGKPFEFELSVGDAPLLDRSEDGRKADYYAAVVQSVAAHSCVCEMRHYKGGVTQASTEIPSTPDPEIARELPDPTLGVLSARANVKFAPVTIISDADIARSDEYEKQKRAGSPQ